MKFTFKTARQFALAAAMVASAMAAHAIPQVFSTKDGAIRGYDPVAYLTENRAVKGQKAITYNWNGAVWHFASKANLEAFKADPTKYAPQFGGYCAYGVAEGYTPETDPQAFKVVDNKLYLNLSKYVAQQWEKDIPGYIKAANENWPRCLTKDDVKAECPAP